MPKRKKGIIFARLFHQKHLLLGYFVTYFIVMFVPYLLGSLYYNQTTRLVYEDTVNMNASVLHHTAAVTDIHFEEISQFAEQLIINPDVCSFQAVNNPFVYPNTYPMFNLCKILSANYSTNRMIENYFLFFNRSEACITGKCAYSYKQLYEIYYQDLGLSYEEWLISMKDNITKQGYMLTQLPMSGKKETCLAYVKPLLSIGDNSDFLLIALNDDLFTDLFSAINISDGGALYIQGIDGNILYSDTTGNIPIAELQEIISRCSVQKGITEEPCSYELTIDGEKMLITSTTTSATHFTYVFMQRADSIIARVNSIKFWIIAILCFSFIIGTVLCYLMSRTSSQPLNAILGELPPANEESAFETAFDRIHSSWYNMVTHNKAIEEALTGQLPYLQYTFLSRLLRRDFSSPKEAEKLADYIHFEHNNKQYTVLLFRICSDILPTQQMDMPFYIACQLAIKEALQTLCPHMRCTEHGTDRIICLYTQDLSNESTPANEITALTQELSKMLPAEIYNNLYLYVGNTVSSLHEIADSLENCESMFQTRSSSKDGLPIIRYSKEATVPGSYFYSYDVRVTIIQHTLAGEEERLHDALHNLLNRNIVENTLPALLFQMFINDLISTLFTILSKMNLPQETYQGFYQELEALSHLDDLQKIYRICSLFKQLCSLVSSRNTMAVSNFIDSVTAYIRKNYASPDLSLVGIADHFHINENYLSLSFKQHTGTNFSAYLETLRMERANMLLCTTGQTIIEIAAAAGYYSSNSFCRAFKRFWGFTPTQCRNGQAAPKIKEEDK